MKKSGCSWKRPQERSSQRGLACASLLSRFCLWLCRMIFHDWTKPTMPVIFIRQFFLNQWQTSGFSVKVSEIHGNLLCDRAVARKQQISVGYQLCHTMDGIVLISCVIYCYTINIFATLTDSFPETGPANGPWDIQSISFYTNWTIKKLMLQHENF